MLDVVYLDAEPAQAGDHHAEVHRWHHGGHLFDRTVGGRWHPDVDFLDEIGQFRRSDYRRFTNVAK